MSHRQLIKLSHILIAVALVLCSLAISAAFFFDQYLSIPQQIAGHASLLLGATALKIGYVVRLTGLRKKQLLEA